MESEATTILT